MKTFILLISLILTTSAFASKNFVTKHLSNADIGTTLVDANINDSGNDTTASYKTRAIVCDVGNLEDGPSRRKSVCTIVSNTPFAKPTILTDFQTIDLYKLISKMIPAKDTLHHHCNNTSKECTLAISAMSCEGPLQADYLNCTITF